MNITIETINSAIKAQETVIEAMAGVEDYVPVLDEFIVGCLKELKAFKQCGLTAEVCWNYKIFEDECIRDGVTFKDILRLKDQLKQKKEEPTAEWRYGGGIIAPYYNCSECGGETSYPNKFCPHCGTRMTKVV